MEIDIRKANQTDSPGLARIQVDSYLQAYAGILPKDYLDHFTYEEQEQDWRDFFSAHPEHVLYVAVDEVGEIIGYALGKHNPHEVLPYEGELIALHVREGQRRQGIGRCLIAAVSRQLSKLGCGSLFLWVLAGNPACSWYERLGGLLVAEKDWQNNACFGTRIVEVAYGWPNIGTLLTSAGEDNPAGGVP